MSIFSELKRRNVFRVAIAYSVTAWLVAQVAELAFDSFGTPEWVMKTLLFVLATGLIFAVIFAWAYEMTPEGIKREKDVDRSKSITDQTGRKLNYTIIGILVFSLAFSVATHRWTTGDEIRTEAADTGEEGAKSIAVLPFVNMSDDPNNEYFSDGISEELLNVLVKVDNLRVASRTSSFSFKGKDTPIPEIAKALQVEHVLEGSVRKAGDTVRVTAQLIDVKTDSHLWSETYDRKLEDIFVIQDEISAHIVEALKVALGSGEVVRTSDQPTTNLAAYEDYLRGRHFWQRRGEDNILKAIELFERAVDRDPGYSQAHAWLACGLGQAMAYRPDEYDALLDQAQVAAQRGLELDACDSECLRILAQIAMLRGNLELAVRHQERGLFLNPNDDRSVCAMGEFLSLWGRSDEAEGWIRKAMRLNPYHPPRYWSHLARALFHLGRFQEAVDALKNIREPRVRDRAYQVAASYAADDPEQTKKGVAALLADRPDFNAERFVSALPYDADADRQALLDALKGALGFMSPEAGS